MLDQTQPNAKRLCESIGAQLVTFRSSREQEAFRALTFPPGLPVQPWLGVRDRETFMDGHHIQFEKFRSKTPLGEHCVALLAIGDWWDVECTNELSTMCEIRTGDPSTESDENVTEAVTNEPAVNEPLANEPLASEPFEIDHANRPVPFRNFVEEKFNQINTKIEEIRNEGRQRQSDLEDLKRSNEEIVKTLQKLSKQLHEM